MGDATTFSVRILGCGSSGGVPRFGGPGEAGFWGACDPAEPKNARRRCSILVERRGPQGATRLLVDTGPDMRQQLLDARVGVVDAVLYTHDHADHTNGVDDLRQVFLQTRRRVPVWADRDTAAMLRQRFDYVFEEKPGSGYPPILDLMTMSEAVIAGDEGFALEGAGGGVAIRPFRVEHGPTPALGFRFTAAEAPGVGGMAYLPDVSDIPESAWPALEGLDLWILDALRYTPHPTHAHVERSLGWIARAQPRRAILTNMHVDLDYATLAAALPDGVEPAYDGLTTRFGVGL